VRTRNPDLHGNVPDEASVALLLIDVINDLEFEGGAALLRHARPMARRLATFKRRARNAGVPAVYVNDNFGRWQSDFHRIVRRCRQKGVRGAPIARLLTPAVDDYFVLKPKHSGFFATTLETLLDYLRPTRLVVTGLTGDNCVLFTASDAYLRDYELFVPEDCVASIRAAHNAEALAHMRRVLKADTRPSTALDLRELVRAPRR
jgi:nicotinamidase-related amidase